MDVPLLTLTLNNRRLYTRFIRNVRGLSLFYVGLEYWSRNNWPTVKRE